MVFRINDDGDGYYLSLDFFKGIVQIRAWGHRSHGFVEEAFQYDQLQAAHYVPDKGLYKFSLIAYQQYIEFSINDRILLTLADDTYEQGRAGFYVENAEMRIHDLELKIITEPDTESYPMNIPNF